MKHFVSVSTQPGTHIPHSATFQIKPEPIGNDYCRFGLVSVFRTSRGLTCVPLLTLLIIAYYFEFVKWNFKKFFLAYSLVSSP